MKNLNIQPLKVPDFIFVDTGIGSDYIKVPVSCLDTSEVDHLCTTFVHELSKKAGYTIDEYTLVLRGVEPKI